MCYFVINLKVCVFVFVILGELCVLIEMLVIFMYFVCCYLDV